MSEHDMPSQPEPQPQPHQPQQPRGAIDISDFLYGATGARLRRLTMPDGSHWFPASHVCKKLGYTTTRKALLDHVPEGNREYLETVTRRHGLSIPAGREWRRDLQLIDLQGLILLISGCTKSSCMPFKQWVTEVILAVQRDGSYALPKAEVQPSDPAAPMAYAMPEQVADAIVRLEERNMRSDEAFAAAQREALATQRETLAAHQATARAMERIADRLEVLLTDRTASPADEHSERSERSERSAPPKRPEHHKHPEHPEHPEHPKHPHLTAEALLADWKARMSVTEEDVWAVAVTIAPVLAKDGELRQSLQSIADRTGLPVYRVNECLRFMREHACILPAAGTTEGAPVYVLPRP